MDDRLVGWLHGIVKNKYKLKFWYSQTSLITQYIKGKTNETCMFCAIRINIIENFNIINDKPHS